MPVAALICNSLGVANGEMDYGQLRKIATTIFHPIEIAVRSNNGASASGAIGTCDLNAR